MTRVRLSGRAGTGGVQEMVIDRLAWQVECHFQLLMAALKGWMDDREDHVVKIETNQGEVSRL